MSLHLDARQRAMLQEMGVTVWGPPTAPAPGAAAPAGQGDAPRARAPGTHPAAQALASDAAVAHRTPTPAMPVPAPARAASAPGPQQAAPAAAAPLTLHPPLPLYAAADPALTPAALGAGWLVVAESATPADPLGGDAGRLLDNMLRAMQLHRHPRAFLVALARAAPGMPVADDIPAALAGAVASLQPSMVLLLGPVAARAALGRSEPLGHLRAGPHEVAGCPAVVTYDPAFLLRSQASKAAAWADLCRALATVRRGAAG